MQQFLDLFPPSLLPVLRLAFWLLLLVMIFVPLERFFAAHPEKILRKGIFTDLGYYFLSSLVPAMFLSIPMALVAWTVHRFMPASFLSGAAALPLWARVACAMVAGEVGYYWGHRWSHEIPILWRFHAIHHSAEHVDFLVNTRAHPIDLVFGRFCTFVPIFVLGLGGPDSPAGNEVPILATVIGTIWGFFIHANLKWRFGPLEWLISTPAFHHWHHTRTGPINRNYASTLPWLDRIFGTHYLPNEWPADYGIKSKMPETLVEQLVHPLKPSRRPAPTAPKPEVAPPEIQPVAAVAMKTGEESNTGDLGVAS